jgi:capsular polysaccharide biosynthesis protein
VEAIPNQWAKDLVTGERWARDLGMPSGEQPIASSARYSLAAFNCVNRGLFSNIAASMLETYEGLSGIDVQPVTLYAFDNATLLPFGTLAVDRKFVRETVDVLPQHYRNLMMQAAEKIDCAETVDEETPVLVIEKPTILNYGHWVVEMMPKMKPMLDHIRSGLVKLCIPGTPSFVAATLTHLGIRTEHLFKPQKFPVVLRKVLYMSPVSKHWGLPGNISPWAVATLNEMTSSVKPGNSRKLFVSRKDASTRRLSNEDEIFAVVEPLGYERIETAKMAFADQVSVFRGADEIIGVFGASMTNAIFSNEGTKALMITPNVFLDHFYWNIASLRGGEYHQVNGHSHDHASDFAVTISDFKAAFDRFQGQDRSVLHDPSPAYQHSPN